MVSVVTPPGEEMMPMNCCGGVIASGNSSPEVTLDEGDGRGTGRGRVVVFVRGEVVALLVAEEVEDEVESILVALFVPFGEMPSRVRMEEEDEGGEVPPGTELARGWVAEKGDDDGGLFPNSDTMEASGGRWWALPSASCLG